MRRLSNGCIEKRYRLIGFLDYTNDKNKIVALREMQAQSSGPQQINKDQISPLRSR